MILLHKSKIVEVTIGKIITYLYLFQKKPASGDLTSEVLPQREVDMLRTNVPPGTQIDEVFGLVRRNLHFPPPASQQSPSAVAWSSITWMARTSPCSSLQPHCAFPNFRAFLLAPLAPSSISLQSAELVVDLSADAGIHG